MNFVNTGVKEVARRLRRQRNRLALANARKAVERTEIALGRTSWRSLPPEDRIRSALDNIALHDGRIAEANAGIARLEGMVREQEDARATARQEHEAAARAIDAERQPFLQTLQDLQAQIAAHQRTLQEQNTRRASLNAGQTSLLKEERRSRRQSLLLGETERTERRRQFDDARASLAEQAMSLTAARSTEAEAANADQRRVKEVRDALKALDKRAAGAAADLAATERAAAMRIAQYHKETAAIRRQAARIEQEKNESFLTIGHLLADVENPPEGGAEAFDAARRTRGQYDKLEALEKGWLEESRNADRQDWRIFLFVCVTGLILLLLAVALVTRSPGKRDWLPLNTEAILSLDVKNFTDADFTRALQTAEPAAWQEMWTGLIRTVADVPGIDVRRQVSRITRALAPATEKSPAMDCLLVELRPSVDVQAIRKYLWPGAGGFGHWDFHGLTVYGKGDFAVAQIGPDTLAIGPWDSVQALVSVRLGLRDDLKTDAQVFSDFQQLDEGPYRLVTYRPRELTYLTDPLLDSTLLRDCQALGLTIKVQQPVTAVFLLNTAGAAEAAQVARLLTASPDKVLQLTGAGPNLFIEPPTVKQHDAQVEWRFRMTEPAAKELLQRISRLELASIGGRKVAKREP